MDEFVDEECMVGGDARADELDDGGVVATTGVDSRFLSLAAQSLTRNLRWKTITSFSAEFAAL